MSIPDNRFERKDLLHNENEESYQSYSRLAKHLEVKARERGVPLHGKFELTPFCNFDCKMCYVHLNPGQMMNRSVLPVNVWKDLIYQAWKAGMISASLTGGECLAYPGFDELYLYLQSLGCDVAVLTNGFLLDEKRIQFFQEHKPSDIQITLYGSNDDVCGTGDRARLRVRSSLRVPRRRAGARPGVSRREGPRGRRADAP